MSKRPVAMPAKQSSRLDSSSDEEDARPIARAPSEGYAEKRAREERERKLMKLKKERKRAEKRAREERERARDSKPAVKRPKKNLSEHVGGVKKGAVVQWKTLEHNGVVFPPAYEPHGVPLLSLIHI